MSDGTQRILYALAAVCFALSAISFGIAAASDEGDTQDIVLAVVFVGLALWAGASFRQFSTTNS